MEITGRVISGVGERGRMGGKIQGIRSINGRYKIDRERLRIAREMEKPKNLYVWPMDMSWVGGMMEGGGFSWGGGEGRGEKAYNCN